VLLGDTESFVGVDLQKSYVEDLIGSVVRVVVVFDARVDALAQSPRSRTRYKAWCRAAQRSESGAPDGRLSVPAVGVGIGHGFEPVGPRILTPAVGDAEPENVIAKEQ